MIARNVLYNLVGLAAPILLAVLCIPPLIRGLGTSAFGLLTLVWVVLGYFSVFDLGIGRALTLAVAARRARHDTPSIGRLVATGTWLTGLLGLVGSAVLLLCIDWIAAALSGSDKALVPQAKASLVAVAVALPFVTTTAALRGVLEAYDRFDLTSAIRLAMGFITYGGPLLVMQWHDGLLPVVAFLSAGRIATWAVHVVAVRRVLPSAQTSPRRIARDEMRPLLVSGGWMTVSNVISPLLTYLDRFVVASIVGAAAVAFYTTPYEAVSRLTIVPDAVLGVLFPALGAAMSVDPERARRLFGQSLRVMLATMLPISAVIVVWAQPLLAVWIDAAFARESFQVLQILTIGTAVNCVARVTFTVIQSAGRPDLTAKLHMCELPVFLVLLVALTHAHGIQGAAVAWSLRMVGDFALLAWVQRRLVEVDYGVPLRVVLAVLLVWAGCMAIGTLLSGTALGWAGLGCTISALWVAGWQVMTAADRQLLRGLRNALQRR